MAQFTHSWHTSLDVHRTWQLVTEAFEDSSRSPIWPNELARLHAVQGLPLRPGSVIEAHYKFGPTDLEARYQVTRCDAPHELRYETANSHPLRGISVISLNASADGGTHCTWIGEYKLKGPRSLVSLPWFKLSFERRFFKRLIGKFQAHANKLDLDSPRKAS